jgi:hypothetical protein
VSYAAHKFRASLSPAATKALRALEVIPPPERGLRIYDRRRRQINAGHFRPKRLHGHHNHQTQQRINNAPRVGPQAAVELLLPAFMQFLGAVGRMFRKPKHA